MSPFQAAIDASFIHLGIAAVLDPDGQSKAVLVLPHEEDQLADFHETQINSRGGSYEIRIADFAGFGKGDILVVAGTRRKVQSYSSQDPRRLKRILRTVPA